MEQFENENKIWWYEFNGQQFGPLTAKEIITLYNVGTINDMTPIWKHGKDNWIPLGQLEEFRSSIKFRKSVNNLNKGYDSLLSELDNGNFFRKAFYWIYKINAYGSIIYFLWIVYKTIETGIFSQLEGKEFFILILLFIGFLIIITLQFLLWNKRSAHLKKINYIDSRFSATPTIAHYIQTMGENASIIFTGGGIIMMFIVLIANLILENNKITSLFENIENWGWGLTGFLILCISIGFLCLLITRLIAESIKALAIIAHNTSQNKTS